MDNHIDNITLRNVLPAVFDHDRHNASIRSSHVWLNDEGVVLKRGNKYLIHAESGTGKTSLCNYIYGNRRDYLGSILFDNTDIRSYKIADWCRIRRRHIAFMPQELFLFPELTVLQNIAVKNSLTRHLSDHTVMHMLETLGISEKANTQVRYLSVGQQQRVALVRTLAQPFDFILLDEPVSHLDTRNNDIAASLVTQHATEQGAAIIATSVGAHLNLDNAITINL